MLSEEFIIEKIYESCSRVKFDSRDNVYNMECCICREGNSRGKTRRMYYYASENQFHCFNCGFHGNSYKFLEQVCGLTYKELRNNPDAVTISLSKVSNKKEEPIDVPCGTILPDKCINLSDEIQLENYKDNTIVKFARQYAKTRRLFSAKFSPKNYWICLDDYVFKNRLIIPFYDLDKKLVFYQGRTILPEDQKPEIPKYISQKNGDKTVFNIDKINLDIPYIFLCEGPIDASFLQNGVGITGINITEKQKSQLDQYIFHKKIWVLDNQHKDKSAKVRTEELLNAGETVFMWPEEYSKYKDINDYCKDKKLDEFPYEKILMHLQTGFVSRWNNLDISFP